MAAKLAGGLREAIPDQVAADHLGDLVWTVLVDSVTAAGQNLHLEAALHLANGQRAVQAVDAGQEQLFGQAQVEELVAQAREPADPILLRLGQIDAPGVAEEEGKLY